VNIDFNGDEEDAESLWFQSETQALKEFHFMCRLLGVRYFSPLLFHWPSVED